MFVKHKNNNFVVLKGYFDTKRKKNNNPESAATSLTSEASRFDHETVKCVWWSENYLGYLGKKQIFTLNHQNYYFPYKSKIHV